MQEKKEVREKNGVNRTEEKEAQIFRKRGIEA